jgi:hypothetical protein
MFNVALIPAKVPHEPKILNQDAVNESFLSSRVVKRAIRGLANGDVDRHEDSRTDGSIDGCLRGWMYVRTVSVNLPFSVKDFWKGRTGSAQDNCYSNTKR